MRDLELEVWTGRVAGSGQGGVGEGRRRRERWRPFFPLGCYCLPISLSLSLPLGFFAAAVVNLFPFAGQYWSRKRWPLSCRPREPVSRNEEERGWENNACRLFSFSPQVFLSIALEGELNERALKTECAGALALRLPREPLCALKH